MPASRRHSFIPRQDPDDSCNDRSNAIKHVVRRASTRFNAWATSNFRPTNTRGRDQECIPPTVRSRSHEIERPNLSAPQSKVHLPPLDTKRSSSLPGNFPELVATTEGSRTHLSPVIAVSPTAHGSPPRRDSGRNDPVDDMVQAALKASSKLQTYVSQALGQRLVDTADGMRVTHTREHVGRTLSSKEAVRRRLLFVCASMSLAADFQEFQRRQARKSRHQRRDSPESPLSPLGMMSGAKQQALHDFVASQAPIDDGERSDLEAAVLAGTKTQIVNAIGQSLHVGNSLGLLCAFEGRRLSELSYGKFPELRMLLREHAAPTERIRSFSSTMDSWWGKQFDDYHKHYTSIRNATSSSPVVASENQAPRLSTVPRAAAQIARPPSVASVGKSETSSGRRIKASVNGSRLAGRRSRQARTTLNKALPAPAPAPEIPRRSSQRPANGALNTPRSRYSLVPGPGASSAPRYKGSVKAPKPKSPPQTPSGTSESHIASQLAKDSRSGSVGSKGIMMRRLREEAEGAQIAQQLHGMHPAVAADVEGRIESFLHELQSQLWGSLRVDPRLVPLQTVGPTQG